MTKQNPMTEYITDDFRELVLKEVDARRRSPFHPLNEVELSELAFGWTTDPEKDCIVADQVARLIPAILDDRANQLIGEPEDDTEE